MAILLIFRTKKSLKINLVLSCTTSDKRTNDPISRKHLDRLKDRQILFYKTVPATARASISAHSTKQCHYMHQISDEFFLSCKNRMILTKDSFQNKLYISKSNDTNHSLHGIPMTPIIPNMLLPFSVC